MLTAHTVRPAATCGDAERRFLEALPAPPTAAQRLLLVRLVRQAWQLEQLDAKLRDGGAVSVDTLRIYWNLHSTYLNTY